MENSMNSGEQHVEQEILSVTWRDWFFRTAAFLTILQLFSFALIKVSEAFLILFFLSVPMFLYSLSFTLYYLYKGLKGEDERQRTVFAIVMFFMVWLLGGAYFITENFGHFEWGYIEDTVKLGYFDELLFKSFEKSYLMIIFLHVPIMLAFKKKRNPSSVVNTTLFWCCTIGLVLACLLLTLTGA